MRVVTVWKCRTLYGPWLAVAYLGMKAVLFIMLSHHMNKATDRQVGQYRAQTTCLLMYVYMYNAKSLVC